MADYGNARLPLASDDELTHYEVPDFSCARAPEYVADSKPVNEDVSEKVCTPSHYCGLFESNCVSKGCLEFKAGKNGYCVNLVRNTKRLVFADKKHESDYDRKYKEYLESLGDDVEPETTASVPVEYDNVFGLVGQGSITSNRCNSFLGWLVCSRMADHKFTTLEGGNFAGKVDAHPVYNFCHKPSCPVCYSKGWGFREANIIEQRCEAMEFGYYDKVSGKKVGGTFGHPEHIIISVPPSDYGLSYEKLKAKAIKVALSRGIIGGVLIWHPKRYSKFDVVRGGIRNMRGWYFAPHWHIIGFLVKNYSKCRNCPKMKPFEKRTGSGRIVKRIGNSEVCKGCDGFEALVRKMAWGSELKPNADGSAGYYFDSKGKRVLGDKYTVKVIDSGETKRNIFGTAHYQLNHSGYKIGAKHFSPETWFGAMSYRRLHVTVEKKKALCRICNNELKPHRYVGHELYEGFDAFCLDVAKICNLVEYDADGKPFNAWVVDESSSVKWFSV